MSGVFTAAPTVGEYFGRGIALEGIIRAESQEAISHRRLESGSPVRAKSHADDASVVSAVINMG
jgi:hypothetical protein